MSCDDSCIFKISVDDPLDHLAASQILKRESYTTYRNKELDDKSESSPYFGIIFSEWVSLVEG
jgi:hypothetical protein